MSSETSETMIALIPCPNVYAKGKKCTCHVVSVKAFKADLCWSLNPDGTWGVQLWRAEVSLSCLLFGEG
jgi:hypothetical protein